MKTMGPDEFLALLEQRLGRPIPVPPPTGEHDDCPICRVLGMTDGPREGVVELFHAQQAVEKAIKGFLGWHDRTFRELGEATAAVDSTLEPVLRRAAPLTEYAWRFRYPGDVNEPPVEEARQALETARDVFEAVLSRLSVEVRP